MSGAGLMHAGVLVLSVLAMEALAGLVHRYVMHGFGWAWHRSHHAADRHGLELNDAYALVFAAAALALFVMASGRAAWIYWVAVGVTVYGVLYGLLHEILVHRRVAVPMRVRGGYVGRLIAAHHLHHTVRERDGGVSFGFLYAPPLRTLRARLRAGTRAGR